MIAYLKATYGVVYKKGIYELLRRLGLSHQRAHADYGNADRLAQQGFVQAFVADIVAEPTATALVFGDEFSVRNNPTPYYGWAEKNTRPTITTNEKKERTPNRLSSRRNEFNGMLFQKNNAAYYAGRNLFAC